MSLKIFTRLTFFWIFNTVAAIAFAQTGSWQPSGADLSFPRTLMKAGEISEAIPGAEAVRHLIQRSLIRLPIRSKLCL